MMRPDQKPGDDFRDVIGETPEDGLDQVEGDLDALYSAPRLASGLSASLDRAILRASSAEATDAGRAPRVPNRISPLASVLSRRFSTLAAVVAMFVVIGVFSAVLAWLPNDRTTQRPQPTPASIAVASPTGTPEPPDEPRPNPTTIPVPPVGIAVTKTASTPTVTPTPSEVVATPDASRTPGAVTSTPVVTPTPSAAASAAPATVNATVRLLAESRKLTATSFIDASRGWLAAGLTISGTTDGGATWTDLGALPSPVVDLDFVSPETGWAATEAGLFATSDGGLTWRAVALGGPNAYVSKVVFVDATNGWVSRGNGQGKVADNILRTTDGGQTWRDLGSPCSTRAGSGVFSFAAPDTGWIICSGGNLVDPQFLRSADGGLSWTPVSSGLDGSPSPRLQDLVPMNYGISDLKFIDDSLGWLAVMGGGLYYTTDGGRYWAPLPLEPTGFAWSVWRIEFVTSDVGYLLARSRWSALLGTRDGGRTWTQLVPPTPAPDGPIAFVDSQHAVGIGTPLPNSDVLASSDGGRTWRKIGSLGLNVVTGLEFADAKNGWATTYNPIMSSYRGELYGTSDGGATWKLLTSWTDDRKLPAAISLVDASTGYVANDWGYLAVTRDGGKSFQTLSEPRTAPPPDGGLDPVPPRGVLRIFASGFGWRSQGSSLLETRDGGRTWKAIPLGGSLIDFGLLSETQAWLIADECGAVDCRSSVRSTRDGGKTWTAYDLGSALIGVKLARIHVADERHVWLVLTDGRLLATADGGLSWEQIR